MLNTYCDTIVVIGMLKDFQSLKQDLKNIDYYFSTIPTHPFAPKNQNPELVHPNKCQVSVLAALLVI